MYRTGDKVLIRAASSRAAAGRRAVLLVPGQRGSGGAGRQAAMHRGRPDLSTQPVGSGDIRRPDPAVQLQRRELLAFFEQRSSTGIASLAVARYSLL